ncbi:hypothetical protein [Muribacter muris]|uniref:hypothetical protein n=1 Tax=Muribacter muris TaxID=67855 RepID=UPI001ADD78DF|nr:hypothetical protein [Muribacter muris]
MEFCNNYLGRYIHHYPYDTHDNTSKFVDSKYKNEYEKDLLNLLKSLMEEIEQTLGIDTVHTWYIKLPKKYGRK